MQTNPHLTRLRPAITATMLASLLAVAALPAHQAAAQDEILHRYDFGTTSSPVEPGYTRVANNTLFNDTTGFGLSRQVASRDRGGPDPLRRDFTVGAATFSQNLSDGEYWVTVLSGDNIAPNYTTLIVEGQDEGLLQSASAEFASWSGAVTVADGRLDIQVGRDSRLNAVTISNVFPPADLSATVSSVLPSPQVDLTWSAAPLAVDYLVTRVGPDGAETLLGTTAETSFTDSDPSLELASDYRYFVQQRSVSGTVSEPSDEVTVTIKLAGVPAPAAPSGLEIVPVGDGEGSVLSWEPVEDAIEYEVQRTDYLPRGFTTLLRTDGTELAVDHAPDSGQFFRWYYRVVAIGEGGRSEPSEPVEQKHMIEPHVVSEIDTSVAGGGARPLLGDVTGDGRLDIVMMQPHHINAGALYTGPKVASLTAFDVTGELLWQVGEVDPEGRNNSQDIPAQIHDIDNDGHNDVIAAMYPGGDTTLDGRIYVLDGSTGEEKWSFDLPDPQAHDTIVFVDASGQGFAGEILLKNRYGKAWLLTADGEVLWEHEGNTGHFPWPYDFDGDGREEIMIGYDMVSPDGELLWSADLPDHADTIWIADINEDGTADVLLGGASTSAHQWDTGEQIWINQDTVESQNILVGKLRDEIRGLQIFGLDRINRTSNGLDGLFLLDKDGQMVWQEERQTRGCYGSIPEIIHNWVGDGRDQIMIWSRGCGEPAGIYTGDGQFVTELSDVRMHHGDFCGDGREEVVEYLQGQWLRVVSSTPECDLGTTVTGEPREQSKREYNYTRYTAGETPVAPVLPEAIVDFGSRFVEPGDTLDLTAAGFGYEPVVATVGADVIGSATPVAGEARISWVVPADHAMGDHTVTVASNFDEATAVITVVPSVPAVLIDELAASLEDYVADGEVAGPIAHQLAGALAQAERHVDSGLTVPAVVSMNRFVKHLDNPGDDDTLGEEAFEDLRAQATAIAALLR